MFLSREIYIKIVSNLYKRFIFNFYFAILIEIIDNIITYSRIVRITSPELQPMAVQNRCHMIQTEIRSPVYIYITL